MIAAVAAALVFDRTVSCPVPVQGGVNVFALTAAGPSADGTGFFSIDLPASLGEPRRLVDGFGSHPGGAEANLKWCKPAAAIPLARPKLPVLQRLGRGGELNYGDGDRCWSGPTIIVRLRAQLDRRGSVVGAQLAVRTVKGLTVYGTSDCMPAP